MFASIFITVALTGGRDIKDFTSDDKKIFSVFVVLEIIDVCSSFALAFAISKRSRLQAPKPPKPSPFEKALKRRELYIALIALAISSVFSALGALLIKGRLSGDGLALALLLTIITAGLSLLISYILAGIYVKNFNGKSNSAKLAFIYSHREHAERSAQRLLGKLQVILVFTRIYSAFIFLIGIAISILGASIGVLPFTVFVGGLVIFGVICRIRLATPKELFSEDNGYVSESDFPELYALAEEVAVTLGIKGEIKIALIADFTAGIRRFNDIISIQIGSLVLGVMSKEELRSIFLHEFAHLCEEGTPASKVAHHSWWLDERGTNPNSLSNITDIFFRFADAHFGFNYMLYMYASTIGIEEKADRAMREYGDPAYAGSSLLKLQYYELYCWEKGSYDTPSLLASEELKADLVKNELSGFREQTEKRRDFWNKMIDVEILSRSATHPTVKMRLDALGHKDYSIHESVDSDEYKNEQIKGVEYLDNKIYENRKDQYKSERESDYLEPLATVEEWEKSGRPISHDEYREVVFALRALGRVSEADELCERVIDELPNAANHYAHFIRGCTLLHSFDESGIEHIYQAVESNHNYIEEGLHTIGQFCCISGRQDELDIYRKKVIELVDKQERTFAELDRITVRDKLTCEKLPDEMHNGLISLILTMKDQIDEVYLVRKIVSNDFFGSPVIVKLKDNTDDKTAREIFNRIFLHLDALDWEFSLFDARYVPMNVIKKVPSSLIYSGKDTDIQA